MSNNSFCKGKLCRVTDRQVRCHDCGLFVCGNCSVDEAKDTTCIDCYLDMKLLHLKHKIVITVEDFVKINKVNKHKARH